MNAESEPAPEPWRSDFAWLFCGLFTPVLAAVAYLAFPSLGGFAKSMVFCLNSFTLPVCCFQLIWSLLNLQGRRFWICLALLILNAAFLLWLAANKALLWVWWFYG